MGEVGGKNEKGRTSRHHVVGSSEGLRSFCLKLLPRQDDEDDYDTVDEDDEND